MHQPVLALAPAMISMTCASVLMCTSSPPTERVDRREQPPETAGKREGTRRENSAGKCRTQAEGPGRGKRRKQREEGSEQESGGERRRDKEKRAGRDETRRGDGATTASEGEEWNGTGARTKAKRRRSTATRELEVRAAGKEHARRRRGAREGERSPVGGGGDEER